MHVFQAWQKALITDWATRLPWRSFSFFWIRDPFELRSDFDGNLFRYLHADGADIREGEHFAELEAMSC